MSISDEGRTYHNTASGYALPNDSEEHTRPDAQSAALTRMMGSRSFLTNFGQIVEPGSPFKAVDVGCGTGVLTVHLTEEVHNIQRHSSADTRVYGLDLSTVPAIHSKPETVEYVQANIYDVKDRNDKFQPGSFDFMIHRRLVLAIQDWARYVKNCFILLKPGGRIELQEVALRGLDAQDNEISQRWKWLSVLRESASILGMDIVAAENLKQLLVDSGFMDVEERVYPWTLSDQHWEEYPDSDEIGQYSVRILSQYFPLGSFKMAQKAGLDQNGEMEGLNTLEEMGQNYAENMMKLPKGSHFKVFVVRGRKP